MSEFKFKVGDEVEVINANAYRLKEYIGRKGEVTYVDIWYSNDGALFLVSFKNEDGDDGLEYFGQDDLKLVEDEELPVGTKVRVIDTTSPYHSMEAVVIFIDDDDLSHYVLIGEDETSMWFRREDLEALKDDGPKDKVGDKVEAFNAGTYWLWRKNLEALKDDELLATAVELEITKERLTTETKKVEYLAERVHELVNLHIKHAHMFESMLKGINELRDEHVARAEETY